MKYSLLLSLVLLVGCSTLTSPIPPYSPGGEYYVAPGTFIGTWSSSNYSLTGPDLSLVAQCTAVISEADSLFSGTITNDSTKEVLILRGYNDVSPKVSFPPANLNPHFEYYVHEINGIGDTTGATVLFSFDRNAMVFSVGRNTPPTGFSFSDIEVETRRK